MENRRVRMTKKMIKEAYIELLTESPSRVVSITDICKTADINRSTFYMHYDNVAAVREEIEEDVLEHIPIMSDSSASATSQRQFVHVLEHFLSYIQENHGMFQILMQNPDSKSFSRRLIENVLEKYMPDANAVDPLVAKYEYLFIVNGTIGILGQWIDDGFPLSADKFSELIMQMSLMVAEIEKVV